MLLRLRNRHSGQRCDADGFSNAQEYGEATNPRDAASRPIPPDIQHIPLADPQTTAAPWMVTAVVTDNVGLARIPNPGQALSFNGVDAYAIAHPVTNFPSSAITVEFWIRSSDTTNHGTPFSYAPASDANEFTLYNYNTFYIHHGGASVDTDVSVTTAPGSYSP